MNSWTFGDQVSVWAVNVVVQAGLVAAVALTIGLGLRRAAALRYGVMLAGLVLISLVPLSAGLAQWSGRSWLSLSINQPDFERKAAAAIPPATTQPGPVAGPSPLREPGITQQSFSDDSFDFAERRPNRLEPMASERRRLADASAMTSSAAHANPSSPEPIATSFGSALRIAVLSLLAIWLAGALGLLVRMAVGCFRLAQILRTATPQRDAAIAALFAEVGRALRLEKLPPIVLSDRVFEPCSAGLLRPRIVLPERMLSHVTPRQLRDVLLHEAAHVARRDQAIVLLQNIVAALFWLHPLVRVSNRQLAQAREEVCDNHVLAATDAPSYSRTLLTLTRLLCSQGPLPGTIGLFTSRWKLESRVAGLLDARRNRRTRLSRSGWAFVCVVALALAGILPLGTISMAVPADDDQPRASADVVTERAAAPNRAAKVAAPTKPAEETPVEANANDPPPRENKPAVAPTEKPAPQALSVSCVGQDGKPVAGAEVHLFQHVVSEPGRYKHFGPYTSDEQGRITCPRAVVYDGRGRFDRWAYARVSGRLVGIARSVNWKGRAARNSEFRVQLLPSRSVEGQVTVPEGFDVTQVTVRVQTLDIRTGEGQFDYESFPRHLPFAGLDTALADVFERRPDREGHIRFDDVPMRGRLCLVTEGTGLAETQWRNEDNVFDEPIRLAASKEAVLTGRIVSPDGGPAVGMNVAAQLSFTPRRQIFHLSTFRATTDENGQFAVHGLPETPFVLSVEDPRHQWTVRPRERLSIATGETQDVAVSMEVGVYVSGRVFDPEGKPVDGAAISALADTQEGSGLVHDMTDRDGRYRLRLPSGRARLYFSGLPDGFVYPNPDIIKRLDITAGQDAVAGLDFTIHRNADDAERAGNAETATAPATAKPLEPDPAVAERIATIAQEHAEHETRFRAELNGVRGDDQKVRVANDRYFADKQERAGDLMYVISEHATDRAAFDGVLLLVEKMNYFLDDSLTEIVLDHHLADPRMGRLCFALRSRGGEAWAARILKTAAEVHPERKVRGQAIFALGDYYRNEAFPYGREVPEAERATLLAEAERCYQRAADDFAQTPTPDGKTTLGDKARHELTRLRNLSNLKVGRPAPWIAAEALDGKPMSLADFQGQVVLLVFWGSWCGPCMEMVPHERELAQRHRGKPFALVGVNCGDTREVAKATMERHHMTWRSWWDGDETRGPIETDYDVPHWPRVFVIDANGIIRAIDPEPADLDRTVEALLQAAAKS